MEIQSSFAAGREGFQRAERGITEATININERIIAEQDFSQALKSNDSVELSSTIETLASTPSTESQLVQLSQEQINAQANVRTIETADEVLGSLIDLQV